MSGVTVEVIEDQVVVQSLAATSGFVLEVPATVSGAYTEVLVDGPQGPPGDTRVWIGNTPPADTSMIWVDNSP